MEEEVKTTNIDGEFKWYCLRTFSGHENKVKQAIESEIKRLELQDKIKEVI